MNIFEKSGFCFSTEWQVPEHWFSNLCLGHAIPLLEGPVLPSYLGLPHSAFVSLAKLTTFSITPSIMPLSASQACLSPLLCPWTHPHQDQPDHEALMCNLIHRPEPLKSHRAGYLWGRMVPGIYLPLNKYLPNFLQISGELSMFNFKVICFLKS